MYLLQNKFGINNAQILAEVERRFVAINIIRLRNKSFRKYDFNMLKSIHKSIFADIYPWAGSIRTVNISKGKSFFCPVERINSFAKEIFAKLEAQNYLRGLDEDEFCHEVADLFGNINALHPFREGNGRTQREFFYHLAKNAGYEFDFNEMDKDKYMIASIESMNGNNEKIEALVNLAIKIR